MYSLRNSVKYDSELHLPYLYRLNVHSVTNFGQDPNLTQEEYNYLRAFCAKYRKQVAAEFGVSQIADNYEEKKRDWKPQVSSDGKKSTTKPASSANVNTQSPNSV